MFEAPSSQQATVPLQVMPHAPSRPVLTSAQRVAKTRAWIDGLSFGAEAADGERLVPVGFPPDKKMRLHDYVLMRQMPNFHFHLVAAYALLRSAGVQLGKGDYLGAIPMV